MHSTTPQNRSSARIGVGSVDDTRHEVSLEDATNNYAYPDGDTRILVGRTIFNVSRSRLTQRSPVFREMFSLPQPVSREQDGEGREYDVQLYDGVNDFSHYLWFVHADALDLHAFATEQEPNVQYKRWLAIAGIAHKYQVTAVADWALNLALCVPEDLRELGKRLANVPGLVKSLLPIFTRWGPDSTQTVRTRNIIRAHLYLRAHRGPAHTYDIARCILPLEEAGDTELLAEVYYYLLVYRAETWLEDAHVRPVDRQRLFRGFHALCRRGIISGKAEEEEYSSSRTQDLRLSTLGEPLWPFFNDVNAV